MAKTQLDRLREAYKTVAKLVIADPVYLPIFERLGRGARKPPDHRHHQQLSPPDHPGWHYF